MLLIRRAWAWMVLMLRPLARAYSVPLKPSSNISSNTSARSFLVSSGESCEATLSISRNSSRSMEAITRASGASDRLTHTLRSSPLNTPVSATMSHSCMSFLVSLMWLRARRLRDLRRKPNTSSSLPSHRSGCLRSFSPKALIRSSALDPIQDVTRRWM